jgi:hypothetical protein
MELVVTLPPAEVSHSLFTFRPATNIATTIGLVCCAALHCDNKNCYYFNKSYILS